MRTDANREFLFRYYFQGTEWGISIHAANPAEAQEKIKAVALARYDGELVASFSVPAWRVMISELLIVVAQVTLSIGAAAFLVALLMTWWYSSR